MDAATIVSIFLVFIFIFIVVSNFGELVDFAKELFHKYIK